MTSPSPVSTSSAAEVTPLGAAPSGRLAALSAFAMAAASIPLPMLPNRALARIRGAVVHDTVARHGLSLTSDARAILAEPHPDRRAVRAAAEAITLQLLRRLRLVGAFAAVARAVEVYALGHLLDRYIVRVRVAGAVRIHIDEARRIREVLDGALLRALSPALVPHAAVLPEGVEDLRDEFTRWIDALLLTGATLPSYLERRLDAAFDQLAAQGGADG